MWELIILSPSIPESLTAAKLTDFSVFQKNTVYMYLVIFTVVLFSRISRVRPSQIFPLQFMSIYSNENIRKNSEIKPSRISTPSPKSWKYLYAKIMAFTVLGKHFWQYRGKSNLPQKNMKID